MNNPIRPGVFEARVAYETGTMAQACHEGQSFLSPKEVHKQPQSMKAIGGGGGGDCAFRPCFPSCICIFNYLSRKPTAYFPQNEHILKDLNPVELFANYTKYEKPTINHTKILHPHFLKSNILPSDIFVANSLTDWCCKANAANYARKLFDQIRKPNVVSWNILISEHNQSSMFEDSPRLLWIMHSLGVDLNQFTHGSVLSACSALQCVSRGRQVYGLVMKKAFSSNGFVRSGMIDLFAKHGCFDEALRVFMDLSCDDKMCSEGSMPNSFTFSSILTACSMLEDLGIGRGIHGLVMKNGAREDVFVGTVVIDFYAKCGSMDEAVKEFSSMPIRNVVSWTAIISRFVQNDDSISALLYFNEMRGMGEEVNRIHRGRDRWAVMITAFAHNKASEKAVSLFRRMFQEGLRPDKFCDFSVLSIIDFLTACSLKMGKEIQGDALLAGVGKDVVVGRALLTMYSRYGKLNCARRVFEMMPPKASMVSGHSSVLNRASTGTQLHGEIIKLGLNKKVSVSSLIMIYSEFGRVDDCQKVFDQIPSPDLICWTFMIVSCARHGKGSVALNFYEPMGEEGIEPDPLTFVGVLSAWSQSGL
ncbi:Pentatricopeptide repeat, partial [Dillenia turbinata]